MNNNRITAILQFIEEDPSDPFNHYALAIEYERTHPEKALEVLKQLAQDHPQYMPTYYKAAHLAWDLGQNETADRLFALGIDLAKTTNDTKTLRELQSAYQNFQFETDG